MSMMVEVEQIGNGKILINLDLVEKIMPAVNGNGSVLHFNNSYLAVKESIKDFSVYAVRVVEQSMLEDKIKKIKSSTVTE